MNVIKLMKQKIEKKINESQSQFFEKISEVDMLLAKLVKKKRQKTEITKIRMKGDITIDVTEIKRKRRRCYETLYANELV